MTQDQIARLFGTTRSNIVQHIQNIYTTGELAPEQTSKKNLQVVENGRRYLLLFYNLELVIAVGYRVNSVVAMKFRQWATQTLGEYVTKGFVMDDERLKGAGTNYFDEWLKRVREIRLSERNLYRKVTDIFATSLDYDPKAPTAKKFFGTVQNKFEFAITGMTAPELITTRINARKDYLGMTNWKGSDTGSHITSQEAKVGKNYMSEEELTQLGLLTEAFLSLAELRARRQNVMYMDDWNKYLNRYLQTQELEVLEGSGKVSRKRADELVKQQVQVYLEDDKPVRRVSDKDIKKYLDAGGEANPDITLGE